MINNRSYLGSVNKYREIGNGSFSKVYDCDYLEAFFAYKEYYDPKYVEFINERIQKLIEFYNDKRFAFPYTAIYKHPNDEYFKGIVMDNKYDYYNLSKYMNLTYEEKIDILYRVRDLIEVFHKEYKMVHTDLNLGNILYNNKSKDVVLIDFDTSLDISDNYQTLNGYYNTFAQYYANNIGIGKDLDIFLFNLSTYAFLNNVDFYEVLYFINNGKYGDIKSYKSVDILNSYKDLEINKTLKKEYIIDYL